MYALCGHVGYTGRPQPPTMDRIRFEIRTGSSMRGLCTPADVVFDASRSTKWRAVIIEACRQFQEAADPGNPQGTLKFISKGRCVDGTPSDTVESMGICEGDIVHTEFVPLGIRCVSRRLNFD